MATSASPQSPAAPYTRTAAPSNAFREAIDKAQARQPLTHADGLALLSEGGAHLGQLMAAAAQLRDQGHAPPAGELPWVTYSRKVFIPLINLCRDVCAYCTFARSENDPKAKVMTPDEVLAVARAGQAAGCKEALFSLGERAEERYESVRTRLRSLGHSSTVDYLAAMCDLVWKETGLLPHSNCGVLERDELAQLKEVNASMGLMLESSSERLLEKGQAHWACPGKAPALRLDTMRTASELGIAFTTGMLIGIGESLSERIDTLLTLRDLLSECEGVQEVIVQNFRAKPDTRFRSKHEPSALDMARTLAVARLILGPHANLQAPPNLSPDAYGFYLSAGINDWGGISPVTRDHINPEAAWPALQEVAAISAEAGFRLRERLALYPSYLLHRPRFVRPHMRHAMLACTDASGLVREGICQPCS